MPAAVDPALLDLAAAVATLAGEEAGSSGRRWVVDPISGPAYFTRHMPLFANLLACFDEHGPAIGVINLPVQREIVFAGRGLGCWLRAGDAAPVLTHQSLDDLAPLPVILHEAGGRISDLTNGPLHDDLLHLVAGLPATHRPKALR